MERFYLDLSDELALKKEELAKQKPQIEGIRDQFIEQSVIFMKQWNMDKIEYYVKNYSEHTITLGKQKLGEMKQEFSDYNNNISDQINKSLSNEKLWWRTEMRNISIDGSTGADSIYHQKLIDSLIRILLGNLYPLLDKFDYLKSSKKYDQYDWLTTYPSIDEYFGDRRTTQSIKMVLKIAGIEMKSYGGSGVKWSDEMNEIYSDYEQQWIEVNTIINDIEHTKTKIEQNKAKDIWDQV